MDIWIISDVHDDYSRTHFGRFDLPRDVPADILVLAGDIGGRLSKHGVDWILSQELDLPVVIAPGNHDFWNASLDVEVEKARARLPSHVRVLDGNAVEIAGVRFVGGTLWTDYGVSGDVQRGAQAAVEGMRDFGEIRTDGGQSRVVPRHFLDVHRRHRAAIEKVLATPFEGQTVVVTHHPPSPQSLRDGGVTEHLDAAYASDLEDVMRVGTPDVWIHGHVHRSQYYDVGATRVFANPRGYVGWGHEFGKRVRTEENPSFDPEFVVRVDGHLPRQVWATGGSVTDPDGPEGQAFLEQIREGNRWAQSAQARGLIR